MMDLECYSLSCWTTPRPFQSPFLSNLLLTRYPVEAYDEILDSIESLWSCEK